MGEESRLYSIINYSVLSGFLVTMNSIATITCVLVYQNKKITCLQLKSLHQRFLESCDHKGQSKNA